MTSLFFVMLVLFVLVIVLLSKQMTKIERERQATANELAKIREIQGSVQKIDSLYFAYDTAFKRHTLKNIAVSFRTGSSNIYDIPLNDLEKLYEVGRSINKFVNDAIDSLPDVKYLLIVEGQSSRDNYFDNDALSYKRALSLVNYWKEREIVFDTQHCEVIISGSGQNSPFRNIPDVSTNKSNQRFVLHIIPSPGDIQKK